MPRSEAWRASLCGWFQGLDIASQIAFTGVYEYEAALTRRVIQLGPKGGAGAVALGTRNCGLDKYTHGMIVGNRMALQKTGICTLYEGDYHIGLAAFVNSLFHAGYDGPVWVGYRGALPPWLHQLEQTSDVRAYLVAGKIRLTFCPLETDFHFTNYKPRFMLDLLAGQARNCSYLWYFDPDVFIRCHWSFFDEWQRCGIALCHEIVRNLLPADSPVRHQWMRMAESIGLRNPQALNHYFNGGMVGVSVAHASFIERWKCILDHVHTNGYDCRKFSMGGREMPFMQIDQDALNVAAMYSEHPLTTMGPEAMGLIPGGFTMLHAIGPKPWRGSFLKRALAGLPPTESDKFFLTQVSAPIRVYSPTRLRAKRAACMIAAFIGRFYRRR